MTVLRGLRAAAMMCVVAAVCLSGCSGEVYENQNEDIPFEEVHSVPEAEQNVRPVLVNQWHTIPDDYAVSVRELPNGHRVAVECYDSLMEMLTDCEAAGFTPAVCSGYRSLSMQESLYQNKVERLLAEGYLRQEAESIAAMEVARPGVSEHHTGLAVDIIDKEYAILDETQEQRPTQQWLLENSWKYGFILRYPTDKTDITGIIYEPWHYRYVGVEMAKIMYEQELCLEEYLDIY